MSKEAEILKRTLQREKQARKQAEFLLEKKAYELFVSNEELKSLNQGLEKAVADRTAELTSANEKLNEFAKVISHDLKAPLKGIHTLIGWVYQDHESVLSEEGKENISLIQERVLKMDAMIQGILEVSQASASKLKIERIDLKVAINDVLVLIKPQTSIQIDVQGEFPTIDANYYSVCQVLQNILSNAIKYSDKEICEIEILGKELDDSWRISIKDNGPGIDEANHKKIFELFETLDKPVSAESTGVGLAIVKKVIEQMNGSITVESTLGTGSTFHINLNKQT